MRYGERLDNSLLSLFSSYPPFAFDVFISQALTQSGVWDSYDDGISSQTEAWPSEDQYALRGWIWNIDQTLHPFWLELARDELRRVSWFIGLDVIAGSPRRARDRFEAAERFEDVEWQFELAGEATIALGRLEIVPGSIRLRARDPEPPAPGRIGRRPRRRRE